MRQGSEISTALFSHSYLCTQVLNHLKKCFFLIQVNMQFIHINQQVGGKDALSRLQERENEVLIQK